MTERKSKDQANIAAGVVVAEPGIVSITAKALLDATREAELHSSARS